MVSLSLTPQVIATPRRTGPALYIAFFFRVRAIFSESAVAKWILTPVAAWFSGEERGMSVTAGQAGIRKCAIARAV